MFDGNSTRPCELADPVHPLNVYGASKAAGEQAVQKLAEQWSIGRTSWLFRAAGLSFPEKILRASESRPELSVVSDQVGSPTYTRDLAAAILQLIHAQARGVLHITNSGTCSWYEFARECYARRAGSIRVLPVTSADFPRPARHPAYSVLSPLSPASLARYGITMRNWKDTIPLYRKELRQVGILK